MMVCFFYILVFFFFFKQKTAYEITTGDWSSDVCSSDLFAGLAGMGDLIVTCEARGGRNRTAGELIARGATPDEAVAQIGQTVEELTTAPVLRDLARRLGIEMPITEGVCAVLE